MKGFYVLHGVYISSRITRRWPRMKHILRIFALAFAKKQSQEENRNDVWRPAPFVPATQQSQDHSGTMDLVWGTLALKGPQEGSC